MAFYIDLRHNFQHSRKHVEAYIISTLQSDFTHSIIEKESQVSGDGFTYPEISYLCIHEMLLPCMGKSIGSALCITLPMSEVVVEKT